MDAIAHLKMTPEEMDFVSRQARRARVRRTKPRNTVRVSVYHPLCVPAVVHASRSSVERVPNVVWEEGREIKVESFTHLARALLTACRSGAPDDVEGPDEEPAVEVTDKVEAPDEEEEEEDDGESF